MMVETKEERTIFGTIDVVQFVLAGHGRIRIGHRENYTKITVLPIVDRCLVDAITAVMVAPVLMMVLLMPVPMVVPVQSRLMIRGRAGRGTAVEGIDAARAVGSLRDTTPVPLRQTFDVRPGGVVRRATYGGRGRTRRKRQCCQVLIVL